MNQQSANLFKTFSLSEQVQQPVGAQISKMARSKKKSWTEEEDNIIRYIVKQHGPKNWKLVTKYLPNRMPKQCRQRWHNHLDPKIKKSSWSHDEEWILYLLHSCVGKKWVQISKYLPGRTDNTIKNHWNSTMRKKVSNLQNSLFEMDQQNKSLITNPWYYQIEQQCIDKLRIKFGIVPQLSKVSTSIVSQTANVGFTCLKKCNSINSINQLVSPRKIDFFLQERINRNQSYPQNQIEACDYEDSICPITSRKLSFLADENPPNLFRYVSRQMSRISEQGDFLKINNVSDQENYNPSKISVVQKKQNLLIQ